MARFDLYAPKLKKWEGVFVYHKNDPGKETNMGVTLATFRQWFGQDKTVEDLKNMTDAQWTRIMKKGYWDVCGADYIENQSVAEIFVDWCINAGPGIIRKVQSIVGVEVDGKVGPKTLIAINAYCQKCLHCKIKDARIKFYDKLAEDKNKAVFHAGWINRTNDFAYDGK